MKLLSWMHRKLQKDATGSLQAPVTGSSCTCLLLKPRNNQGDYITPSIDSKHKWQPNQQCQHHLKEFNPENTEESDEKQTTKIFSGFLSIGTLRMEPISEPPMPTFDLPYQVTNEGDMEHIKYDLKLINEELEKFLKVEAEKEGSTDSSRKNSQASTITLSDELIEDMSGHNSIQKQVYPLQGYLFGSSTEVLEKKPKAKEKKASLNEIFKKSTTMEKITIKEAHRIQKQATKDIKSSNHLMNKMLQPTQTSPKISNYSTGHAAESFRTPRKLNKINQFFHKKVHPEINTVTSAAKDTKFRKIETKKNVKSSDNYESSALRNGKSKIGCWGSLKKGKKYCSKIDMKQPQETLTKKNLDHSLEDTSGVANEHWINTDEEYLVLELQQNEGVQY